MKCANCKKPGKLACSSCKQNVVIEGDPEITHYCSSACQKEDWKSHKIICHRLRDRTTLYRVATTAQNLWYIWREISWANVSIKAVERTKDHLILRGEYLDDVRWPMDYTPFPSTLFSTAEERKAALSYVGCIDAMHWMTEFVDGMLKDIVSETKRITHKTMNDKLRTREYHPNIPFVPDGRGITHEILKISLTSGEEFAVDLAGAQYGYGKPVTPWKEYAKCRILWIYNIGSPPEISSAIKVDNYSKAAISLAAQKMFVQKDPDPNKLVLTIAIENMVFYMLMWQLGESMSLKTMWKLPEKRFVAKQTDLVNFIEWQFSSRDGVPYSTVNGKRLVAEVRGKWVHGKE